MLLAVGRDDSLLAGGISTGKRTVPGTAVVEPIASINSAGKWTSIKCDNLHPVACKRFEREFLNKPHTYSVITADGYGAVVKTAPTTLSECYGYSGAGTYAGAAISAAAVAASSTEFFDIGAPMLPVQESDAAVIRKELGTLIPEKLDSTRYLRLFATEMDGRRLVLVQRSFAEFADENVRMKFFFAIGTFESGHFQLLYWKRNVEDEDERVIGMIRFKSGLDFLVTTASDPESQRFHVYGMQNGKLVIVYSGGGESC